MIFRYFVILLFLCFSNEVISQEKSINDKILQQWINSAPEKIKNSKYFLLLNPNYGCAACHKFHLEAVIKNNELKKVLCVITYDDIKALVPSFNTQDLLCIIKNKSDFSTLQELRYTNCLISRHDNRFYLVLKLAPSNVDTVRKIILGK